MMIMMMTLMKLVVMMILTMSIALIVVMMMAISADFGVSAICESGARRNSFIGSPYWLDVNNCGDGDDDVVIDYDDYN